MKIQTRYFGEVEIGDEKIVHFDKGLFGFEEYKDYTILYDIDGEEPPFFSWLQSTTEPGLAFPIVNPQRVDEQYNPIVEDALLESVGEIKEDDLVVFLLATVPADVKRTSVNKKAPLIINAGTRKGVQIVAGNTFFCSNTWRGDKIMLALARKVNESIMIGNDIEITVLEIKGDQIKLGVKAPKSVPIYRKELYVQIQEENKQAGSAVDVEALRGLFQK